MMRFVAALVLLSACAGQPAPVATVSAVGADNCVGHGIDALGMEDGMNGFGPELQVARLASCRAVGVAPDEARYAAAYADGAVRYCGLENAHRLGRKGVAILRDCPGEQQAFDDAYEQGLQMRDALAPLPHIGVVHGGQRRSVGPASLL